MRNRRRNGGGDDHGGGGGHDGGGSMRWLLTYADMITLLMVFFIVMYAMSNLDNSRYIQFVQSLRAALLNANVSNSIMDVSQLPADTTELLPGVAGNKMDPLPISQSELLDLQMVGEELAQALQEAGLNGQVEITLADRGLVISFADNVFFDLGQAVIRPESSDLLTRIAAILRRLPNRIAVEGHTDNLPIHTVQFPSNWELSVARAVAVARFFSEKGDIEPERLGAIGYGEWRPKYPNDTEEHRAKNRRVDIVLLSEAFRNSDLVREVITSP